MPDQVYIIPKQQDNFLIDFIKKISLNLKILQPTITITLGGGVTFIYDQSEESYKYINIISEKNTALIYQINCQASGTIFNYYRGSSKDNKSPFSDEVRINLDNSNLNTEKRIDFVSFLITELKAFDPNFTISNPVAKEQSELIAIHESTLHRLEALNEKLIEETQSYRVALDEQLSEKEKKLINKYNDLENNLKNSQQERLLDIINRENELTKHKKELDDKSNTHARRQIRKDILSEIKRRQEEFKLTKGTNKLRVPITLAMLSLIGLFAFLSATSIINFNFVLESKELNKDIQILLLTGVKQIIYSIGAVASVLYYIRWNNRWFEQHSIAEFQLKQFELDMERASWIVETSLEWKDAKGTAIPSDLLNSLSKNLFSEAHEKIDPLVHPADQLASALLGSASMIKLKAGDSEIQIDPKKLEKVKSAVE